ncbi:MAG: kelch repeat-containing protein [Terracidiphilus sp.]
MSWTDSSGNLWLFGGDQFNDLWEFNPTAKTWTWVSGSSEPSNSVLFGVYGSLGVPAAANVPGGRYGSVSWIDTKGNLWLFGGSGLDSTGMLGSLNDLWEFNPVTKEWTWVSGSNTAGANGVYGTQGVASAGNVPGARTEAVSWIDSGGNLWLFGGSSTGNAGDLNDLWEFNPVTKEWTWVSGSNVTGASRGVYGTQGVAADSNVPGSREGAVSWIDADGNLWLFGGTYSASPGGNLNDLWKFNPVTKEWTWVSGSNVTGASRGVYGTQGVAADSNVPGSRENAAGWIDADGNLWLFGGTGPDSTGALGNLNDLWRYQP